MGKYIRASVKFEAIVQIDDNQSLFRMAELVPEIKDRLLREIKKNAVERTKGLDVESLTFEEVIFPDKPKSTEKTK